jgi:hypothetical protein
MMEAAKTSETVGNFYQTTQRDIPEDSFILSRRFSRGTEGNHEKRPLLWPNTKQDCQQLDRDLRFGSYDDGIIYTEIV